MTVIGWTLWWMLAPMLFGQNASRPPEPPRPADHTAESSRPATTETGFLFKSLDLRGTTYAYSVYVPPEYAPDRAWPVVLFLHGSGERGSDGLLQTEVGIGTAIRRNRALCPAIVVMPQCRPSTHWAGEMSEMALKCVEKTSREYNLDPDRVYLTGLSLGGAGAWALGNALPDRFAAIVPICGFVGRPDAPADAAQLRALAQRLASVPIWCFHGAVDRAVSVQRSQEVIAALRAAGGAPRYTEYPNADHNSWDAAYADPELWKWLLAQKRPRRDANPD